MLCFWNEQSIDIGIDGPLDAVHRQRLKQKQKQRQHQPQRHFVNVEMDV